MPLGVMLFGIGPQSGATNLQVSASGVNSSGSGFSQCGDPGQTGSPGTVVTGGSGTYTYSWARTSAAAGGGAYVISSATVQNPIWSAPGNSVCWDDTPDQEIWEVNVTDTVTSQTGSTTILVFLRWTDLS